MRGKREDRREDIKKTKEGDDEWRTNHITSYQPVYFTGWLF
jgi:hypothetical protein